jgi:hypothetical protein
VRLHERRADATACGGTFRNLKERNPPPRTMKRLKPAFSRMDPIDQRFLTNETRASFCQDRLGSSEIRNSKLTLTYCTVLYCTVLCVCFEFMPKTGVGHGVWVRKRHLLNHLYINAIFSPRQARDKHRESTQKQTYVFSGNRRARRGQRQLAQRPGPARGSSVGSTQRGR